MVLGRRGQSGQQGNATPEPPDNAGERMQQGESPIEIAETYENIEAAYRHACQIGEEMAQDEGNTEFDNPFETGPLRESWLYGFRRVRKWWKPKPKVNVDWKRDGF